MPLPTRRDVIGCAVAAGCACLLNRDGPRPARPPVSALSNPDGETPLPPGVFRRIGSDRYRCRESMSSVLFDPTGTQLLTTHQTGYDLWNADTGRIIRKFPNRFESPLFWNAAGEFVNLDYQPKKLTVRWLDPDAKTVRQVVCSIPTERMNEITLCRAAMRAYVSVPNELHAFDLTLGTQLWMRNTHDRQSAYVVTDDQNRRVICHDHTDGFAFVFDPETGQEIVTLSKTSGRPITISPDGTRMLWMGYDWKTRNHYLAEHEVVGSRVRWRWPDADPESDHGVFPDVGVAYSPDGSKFVLHTRNRTIVCDTADGSALFRLAFGTDGRAFSHDGRTLAVVKGHCLSLLDARTGKPLRPGSAPKQYGPFLHFSDDGLLRVEESPLKGGEPGTTCLVDPNDGREERLPHPAAGTGWAQALSPDAALRMVLGAEGMELRDARSLGFIRTLMRRDDPEFDEEYLWSWFGPDGRHIYLTTPISIRILSREGDLLQTVPWPPRVPASGDHHLTRGLQMSADERTLACTESWTPPLQFRLAEARWNHVSTFDLVAGKDWISRFLSSSSDVRMNLDGTTFYWNTPHNSWRFGYGSPEHLMRFETETGRKTVAFAGPFDPNSRVEAVTPDGRVAVLVCNGVSWDGFLLYEFVSNTVRWKTSSVYTPYRPAFSPDGRVMATMHPDAPIYLWDVYGERTDPKPRPKRAEFDALWEMLAERDGSNSFPVIRQLVQHPAEAVELLAARLRPLKPGEPTVRQIPEGWATLGARVVLAARGVEGLSEPIDDRLRRLQERLARIDALSAETIRGVRSLEILEAIRTPAARRIVEAVAAGAADAPLTRDAAATLRRWG